MGSDIKYFITTASVFNFCNTVSITWDFRVVLVVKSPPANVGDARDMGWEDPLEDSMAIHSSVLALRIPWTEEPDRL